jgi:hypothetical protein
MVTWGSSISPPIWPQSTPRSQLVAGIERLQLGDPSHHFSMGFMMEIRGKGRFLSTFRVFSLVTQRIQGSSKWSMKLGSASDERIYIVGTFYLFQNWSIVLSIDESTWFRTLISAVRVAGWIGIVMAMTLWSSKAPFLKFVFWGCPKGVVQCLVSLRFTFRSTSGSFCGNRQEQSQPQAMTPIFRYYPVSFSSYPPDLRSIHIPHQAISSPNYCISMKNSKTLPRLDTHQGIWTWDTQPRWTRNWNQPLWLGIIAS